MAIRSRLQILVSGKKTDALDEELPVADIETPTGKKTAAAKDNDTSIHDSSSDEAAPSQSFQTGVQKIQAVTLVWSKWSLVAVLCLYVFLHKSVSILDRIPNDMLQTLACYLSQWIQNSHSLQPDPVRHQRFSGPFAFDCHQYRFRCYDICPVYPGGQACRCLGPC